MTKKTVAYLEVMLYSSWRISVSHVGMYQYQKASCDNEFAKCTCTAYSNVTKERAVALRTLMTLGFAGALVAVQFLGRSV